MNEYPPAGTWDVIDRHGEPRYVVEHDGKGGWWGVCQPDRPEDCYVLAASKEMLSAIKQIMDERDSELDMMRCDYAFGTPEFEAWHQGVYEMWRILDIIKNYAKPALRKAEGK
jgi:hypothetical protein